jgi:hypothetical protein
MSSCNYVETHVEEGTSFFDVAALGTALEALNDFDPSQQAGPSYAGFVKFTGKHLGLYESNEGQDQYMTRLRIFCDGRDIAREIAKQLATGQVILLDLPEGNPAAVLIITPGNVRTFVDANDADWAM